MKLARLVVCLSLGLMFSSGCVSGPGARTGTAFGGLGGALVGAAAGADQGKSLEGAAMGALAGSALGGAIGNAADEDAAAWKAEEVAREQQVLAQAVTIDQVIQMSQSGLGEQVIANQIRSQGVFHPLSTNDLVMLKQNGVADSVIAAWQQQSAAAVTAPAVSARPIIVREHWIEPSFGPDCYYYGPAFHQRHRGTRAGIQIRFP